MSFSEQLIHQLTGPKFDLPGKLAGMLISECNKLAEIPLEQRDKYKVKNELEEAFNLINFPKIHEDENFKTELLDTLKDYVSKALGITAQKGNMLKEINYKEWLKEYREKESFDGYYWARLKKYLLGEGFIPPEVVATLDHDSDKITDLLGNPHIEGAYRRRGMVMGSVQSGKTLSYSSVITKAADAGYKIIVLITTNIDRLRVQTQERIDEAFIGRKTLKGTSVKKNYIGVGKAPYTEKGNHRFPIYFTNTSEDYSAAVSKIDTPVTSIKTPLIFVVKKNVNILLNIIKFFENEEEEVTNNFPLFLIDDEADYASINTKAHLDEITLTNERIRNLLKLFKKNSYLAYTATPYANIFINPDNTGLMEEDDLFPGDFIYTLNPPSNYYGPNKIFTDNKGEFSHCVEEIVDHFDVIPIKHKNGTIIPHLPESLKEAVLSFIILRCIFISKGMEKKHCTMMVNISPFNSVQNDIYGKLYIYLDKVKQEIEVKAKLDNAESRSTIINNIKNLFDKKFSPYCDNSDDISWKTIIKNLITGSKTIGIEASQQGSKTLDYEGNKKNGLHVIVVGGYTLSRGLTLEGLCVSYLIRNAAAYDTLFQMGRWFGYRDTYGKFCKIYLPTSSIDWYTFVSTASNELYLEIEKMNEEKRTPREFGLKVRNHPDTLRITAANKMRYAEKRMIASDYSGKHMQAYQIINSEDSNNFNRKITKDFVDSLGKNNFKDRPDIQIKKDDIFWENIEVDKIISFLTNFKFSDDLPHFNNKLLNGSFLVLDYINDKKNELLQWDILLPQGEAKKFEEKEILPGKRIIPAARNGGGVEDGTKFFVGNRNRSLPSEGVLLKGKLKIEKDEVNIRQKPMLFIHIQKCEKVRNEKVYHMPVFTKNFIAISIEFPKDVTQAESKEYMINQIAQQEEFPFVNEIGDEEGMYEE